MNNFKANFQELSILYVEDETESRKIIEDMLKSRFKNLWVADNGDLGLELFEKHHPNIIISDIRTPMSNGIEFVRRIRQLNHTVQIILVTSSSDTHYLLDAIDIGVSQYLVKPVRRKNLFQAIDHCANKTVLEWQIQKQNDYIYLLYQAVEQSPGITVITDVQGNIEYVNPKFTETTGYTLPEVQGKTNTVLKSGDHSKEFYESIWERIMVGKEWKGEFCNKKKDGTLYWEQATISPIRNEFGHITYFMKISEDSSNQHLANEMILESEAKYFGFFNHSKMPMLILNSSGQIIDANTKILEMTKLRIDEMQKKHYKDIFDLTDDQKKAFENKIGEIFENDEQGIESARLMNQNFKIMFSTFKDKDEQKLQLILCRADI